MIHGKAKCGVSANRKPIMSYPTKEASTPTLRGTESLPIADASLLLGAIAPCVARCLAKSALGIAIYAVRPYVPDTVHYFGYPRMKKSTFAAVAELR